MKAGLIIVVLTVVVWAVNGNAQTQQDEEQVISEEAFEQIELDAGSDVDTRGLRLSSHAGTISEIHLNRANYESQNRGICIKMNPPIPGTWACLYMQNSWMAVDPLLHPQMGIVGRSMSVVGDYYRWLGNQEISRLLHDAFISNKRCWIEFSDGSSAGKHNMIQTVACYNQ